MCLIEMREAGLFALQPDKRYRKLLLKYGFTDFICTLLIVFFIPVFPLRGVSEDLSEELKFYIWYQLNSLLVSIDDQKLCVCMCPCVHVLSSVLNQWTEVFLTPFPIFYVCNELNLICLLQCSQITVICSVWSGVIWE